MTYNISHIYLTGFLIFIFFFRYRASSSHANPCFRAFAGKSSLAVQFVDGHFVESYYPTIENTFSKVIRFKGQDYATEIVDTAGQVNTYICQPCLF